MINQAFKNPGVQAYDVPEILPDGTREDYELGNVRITITQPREDRYSPKRVFDAILRARRASSYPPSFFTPAVSEACAVSLTSTSPPAAFYPPKASLSKCLLREGFGIGQPYVAESV